MNQFATTLRRAARRGVRSLEEIRRTFVGRSKRGLFALPGLSRYHLRQRIVSMAAATRRVSSLPDVRSLSRDDWHLLIRASEVIRRRGPVSMDAGDAAKFEANTSKFQSGCEYRTPEVMLAGFANARVYSRDLLVLTQNRRVVLESALAQNEVLETNGLLDRFVHPRVLRKPGSYALLSNPWADGYYHWLMDALPKYSILERFSELQSVPLLVQQRLQNFQRDSLAIIGIPLDRIVQFAGGCWQVDQLYVPTLLSGTGNPSPEAVAWLRKRFLDSSAHQAPGTRRIYITRRDASQRRVVNEAEIVEQLRQYGFEIVCPGDLSFQQQVKLFSEVEFVVAAHGAGCTNMVFAPAGATLVELFGDNYINGCFWALANIRGQRYGFVVGPNTDALDFRIPAERLRLLLERQFGI